MKSLTRLLLALSVGLVAFSAAGVAQETGTLNLTLNGVTYPDNKWIDVRFTATQAAPTGAELKGRARARGGQTQIELDWKNMQPAALYGGNIAAYAVYAVTPEGTVENLGELPVRAADGKDTYATGRKTFALVVAPDVTATLPRPSDLVVFFSNPTPPAEAKSTPFPFSNFRKAPAHERESLAGASWTDKTPIELVQAERAMAAAKQFGAAEGNPEAMKQAETALAQARNLAGKGGDKKALADYSARAIALATTAAVETNQMRTEKAAAEAEAKRKAEADALAAKAKSSAQAASAADARAQAANEQAAAMEARARDLEAQQQTLLAQQQSLELDRQALILDRDRIREERDALAQILSTALSTVAAVRESAAGTIVDLPGILFDTGKAELKPGAKVTIAKLSGILMMFPGSSLEIRGHTDSVGTQEANLKLSKDRAKSVYDFLGEQGLPKERMKFDGSGSTEPIAGNDTAEGRAKNRRVEVLIIEGGALEAAAEAMN